MYEIPFLGDIKQYKVSFWLKSEPVTIPVFNEGSFEIILEDYETDQHKEDFHVAIKNFFEAKPAALKDAEPHIYRYYQDCFANMDPSDDDYLEIEKPKDLWSYIEFGKNPIISRRLSGDKEIYISLACNCEWEPEHGLQLVFKNGLSINKVGPCDGHLTNSDTYANPSLEDVVYRSFS